MVNRIEIERLLQSKELKELWQTIQQELPQLYFCIGKLIKYWDIIMIKALPKTMEVH